MFTFMNYILTPEFLVIISLAIFLYSFFKDSRRFRNAVFLLILLFALFVLSVQYSGISRIATIYSSIFVTTFMFLIFIIPFLLMVNSVQMLLKEGFHITSFLSIAFGIFILVGEFYFITSMIVAVNNYIDHSIHLIQDFPTLLKMGFGFSVLYIGLAFLGNHFNVASALAKDADLNVGSYVLTMASRELFGTFGQAFLAVMVVITCLTTTVGLIVSVGEFFEETFPRFSYKVYATVFTLIGFGVATLGLQTIIAFSLPVLMILYPITVVIAFFVLVNKKVAFSKKGMQLTVALTTIISTVSSLASALKLEGLAKALEILPLQGLSLGWMGPAIIGILIALILPDKIKGEAFDFEAFQTK